MKVALYARVSTVKQAEKELSIPDQIRQIREWCERNNHIVAKEYVEEGTSATDERRAVFQEMIHDACLRPPAFDCIVVHSLSRFFRDLYGFIYHEKKLNKAGVKIISITQQTGDDPAGEMARKIFNLFDEYQSKENSKHTLRAMRENARKGFFNGSIPKFGFRVEYITTGRGNPKGKLMIDPTEVSVVRKIFDLYLSFLGAKQIAETLNRSGELRRGRAWTKNAILNILADPAYGGNLYFNRYDHRAKKLKPEEEWIMIKVPPIISKEVWDKAQKIRKDREPQTTNPAITGSKTLLTGLAFCGLCGSGMQMETGKGGSYTYYNCRNYVRSGKSVCQGRRIPAPELENAVLNHMAQRIFTKDRIKKILIGVLSGARSMIRRSKNLRNKLIVERKDVESRLQKQYEAIEKGVVNSSDVSERISQLKVKRSEIDERLRDTPGFIIPPNVFTDKAIENFQTMIRDVFLSPERDFAKSYLKLLIERVTINGRKVKIEGRPSAILATMQNKTAVRSEVPTAVSSWLPGQDSNLQPSG
jgi:site-specific DNA recombinase